MKEGSKPNHIVKLPESNDPNKNSHRRDYNDEKDALRDNDYESNKYDSQTHPAEDTRDTDQRYEDYPSHTLSSLTPHLLNPSRNSSPTSKGPQSDSDESVCSSRGGMSDSSSQDAKFSLSKQIGTVCPRAEWKEESEEE
jgi:hypothetical protein